MKTTFVCFNYVLPWKDIESAFIDNIPIQAMIANRTLFANKDKLLIGLSLKIWNDVKKGRI